MGHSRISGAGLEPANLRVQSSVSYQLDDPDVLNFSQELGSNPHYPVQSRMSYQLDDPGVRLRRLHDQLSFLDWHRDEGSNLD